MKKCLALVVARVATAVACAGARPVTPHPGGLHVADGVPPLAVVSREGDPAAAIAAFVSTEGIASDAGASAAVALGALVEGRLRAQELEARAIAGYDAVRIDVLVSPDRAARAMDGLRHALLDPVGQSEDLDLVRKRLDALARLPADGAAPCTGAPSGGAQKLDVGQKTLEFVRASAAGIGRVALAVVGDPKTTASVRVELASRKWPSASAAAAPRTFAPLVVEEGPPRVRAFVMARAPAAMATAAASAVRRLSVLRSNTTLSLRSVTAALHASGACIALDLEGDASEKARIASALALAKRALSDALDAARGATAEQESQRAIREAGDARDAAGVAAAWALQMSRDPLSRPTAASIVVLGSNLGAASLSEAIARASADLEGSFVESVIALEPGQGSVILLLASPCGTDVETTQDAGVSALYLTAAARAFDSDEVRVEPWIASDGVGLIARAPAQMAERAADVLGRAFAFDDVPIGASRGALLKVASPGLAVLGAALAPNHPSWVVPTGTADALLRIADGAVSARASAIRSGPLRVAILADVDRSATIKRSIGRWILRKSGERACEAPPPRSLPAPGTYAAPAASSSEAWLALPLSDASIAAAPLLAAMLDGEGSPLTRALAGSARSSSARVLGMPRAPALVVHVEAPAGALDASVAVVRTLFDRLRRTGPTREEIARARRVRADALVHARLDPRARVIALWRDEKKDPVLDDAALIAAAADVFRDEALVVVAARPGSGRAGGRR